MAGIQELVVNPAVPLHKLQIVADGLLGLFPLNLLLLLQVRAHDIVKVAVRFGPAGHGGRRRSSGLLVDDVLYGLGNAFYARDVSLALLQIQQSILVHVPMERTVGLRWAA
jgi:hypothetical protein